MPWFFDGARQPESALDTTAFEPRVENTTTNQLIDQVVPTSIFQFAGEGSIQAFTINFSKQNVDVILEVDGIEVLNINLTDLNSNNEYDLSSYSGVGPFPIRMGNNNQSIIVDFSGAAAQFLTSFEIKALANASNLARKAAVIIYREKVSAT